MPASHRGAWHPSPAASARAHRRRPSPQAHSSRQGLSAARVDCFASRMLRPPTTLNLPGCRLLRRRKRHLISMPSVGRLFLCLMLFDAGFVLAAPWRFKDIRTSRIDANSRGWKPLLERWRPSLGSSLAFVARSSAFFALSSVAQVPCTPAGCVELLQRSCVDVAGKSVVVLGRPASIHEPVGGYYVFRSALWGYTGSSEVSTPGRT